MKQGFRFASVLAMLGIVGCSTVFDAHEAQKEVSDKGCGTESRTEIARVDLRGRTLRQLVEYAMTNRPTVVAARLAVEDARLNLKTVAADAPLVSSTPWTAPKLSTRAGYAAVSDSSATRLGWHAEGSASVALSLELLVWDFGRNSAAMRAAAENVVAAEQRLTLEGYSVFEDVAISYFTLLESDALLKVARTNEYEYAEHYRQAKERLDAGEAQRLDVTRARLDLAQARQKTVAASNLVVTSGAELMRALGIDADRGTRADVLPPLTAGLGSVMRGFAPTKSGVGELFDFARTNAPAMAVARAKLRGASADVDRAIADLMPSVSLSGSLNWTDPLWYWSWGANAAQSLFQGFRKVTAVDRAVVAMKSAACNVDETEQELSRAVSLAVATRDDALEARKTARESVRAARENYDTVRAQYGAGEASRIDFTDAIGDYAQAVGTCITAFYKGQIAEAKLFALTGTMPDYREELVKEAK